jgi:hypothetical protein
MHGGVQDEAGAVQSVLTFDHDSLVVCQDEVGHTHFAEVDTHGVGPVEFRKFRIPNRQMTGKTVLEAFPRESAASGNQALLQMQALFFHVLEGGLLRIDQTFLQRLVDGHPAIGQAGGDGFLRWGSVENSWHWGSLKNFGAQTTNGHVVWMTEFSNRLL